MRVFNQAFKTCTTSRAKLGSTISALGHLPLIKHTRPHNCNCYRDILAQSTASYVAEVADTDRSGELFMWIFKDLFGSKPSSGSSTSQATSGKMSTPVPDGPYEVATVGGGCFWCLDACYRQLKGVYSVYSGYAGGALKNPTYEQICNGKTGHAEVVQITYNPNIIKFDDILAVFFTIHDPTTLNRQGNDSGTQYRSIILYHDDKQKEIAKSIIAEIESSGVYSSRVVTEVAPLSIFYKAEDYHQDYFTQNPSQGYCRMVVAPKVKKFSQKYAQLVKD